MSDSRMVRLSDGTIGLMVLLLSVNPSIRPSAQTVADLTLRLSAMTAVSGYEQAVTDSLVALLPGSAKDRAGNVVLTLGRGAPKRLAVCPLDEPGYVVGNITDEDRKSTRLNSSHDQISYAVFCLKKKKTTPAMRRGSRCCLAARF